ncbi:putative membrane protein [Spathaspora sp. JA1]|nr:putative membrane protein [Spathaspora sp. JA1]
MSKSNTEIDVLQVSPKQTYDAVLEPEEQVEDEDEDMVWLREQQILNGKLSWYKRPSVLTIGFVLFVYIFSASISAAVKQIIIYKMACNSMRDENGICDPITTQVLFSNYNMYSLVGTTIVSLFASTKVGQLSDIYGRQPFIAGIIITTLLTKLGEYLISTHYDTLKLKSLLAVAFISGILGGMTSAGALLSSYISDVVDPSNRTYSLALGSASLYIGQSLGPIVGNWLQSILTKTDSLAQVSSVVLPSELVLLQVEIILQILLCIYAVFYLPESRSEKAKQKSKLSSINNDSVSARNSNILVHSIHSVIKLFSPLLILTYPTSVVGSNHKPHVKTYRSVVILLIVSSCICTTVFVAFGPILLQYGVYKFNWGSSDIGYVMTIISATRTVVLMLVIPFFQTTILQKLFGYKPLTNQLDMVDFCMIITGYVSDFLVFTALAFASTNKQVMVITGFFAMGATSLPACNSAVLKFYPASMTGLVFGAWSLLNNVLAVFAPMLLMSIYNWSLRHHIPSFVFLVYAGSFFVVIIMC